MQKLDLTTVTALIIMLVFSASPGLAAADTTLQRTVVGNTRFTLDLYQILGRSKGNLIVSPFSISTALAMTQGGARGETEKQIARALRFEPDQDKLHTAFLELQTSLKRTQSEGTVELHVANSIWPQDTYPFLDAYVDLCRQYYGVNITPVDYSAASDAARLQINQWVEQKTASKIKNLLRPGSINALTRLVLVNAIYFKGDWALPFYEARTRKERFYLDQDEAVQVPMMSQLDDFRYGENRQLQVLELPYAGRDLSMLLLLPKKRTGLSKLEKDLSAENLQQWTQTLVSREVQVFLPKFKTEVQFDLKSTLQALGVTDAFIPGTADFSGMDGKPGRLSIGTAVHKAFIEVNEEGTEAAAATGIGMSITSVAPARPKPVVFRADHPFVYIIRDKQTNSILFMGKVTNPG